MLQSLKILSIKHRYTQNLSRFIFLFYLTWQINPNSSSAQSVGRRIGARDRSSKALRFFVVVRLTNGGRLGYVTGGEAEEMGMLARARSPPVQFRIRPPSALRGYRPFHLDGSAPRRILIYLTLHVHLPYVARRKQRLDASAISPFSVFRESL